MPKTTLYTPSDMDNSRNTVIVPLDDMDNISYIPIVPARKTVGVGNGDLNLKSGT